MVIELSIIIDGRIEQPQIDTVGSHVHLKLPDGFSTGKLINVGEVKIVSDIRESHELMYYLDYELQKYE
ncbi:hypothetical protein JCM19233_5529 [Vibrio astriarenae]|nr:hypothetical protein JCM19233_5529 [Vibrio sp. C7]